MNMSKLQLCRLDKTSIDHGDGQLNRKGDNDSRESCFTTVAMNCTVQCTATEYQRDEKDVFSEY